MSENRSIEYFTSPLGEINYCNKCTHPIIETEGRYIVDVQHDIYLSNGYRLLDNYGHKS